MTESTLDLFCQHEEAKELNVCDDYYEMEFMISLPSEDHID